MGNSIKVCLFIIIELVTGNMFDIAHSLKRSLKDFPQNAQGQANEGDY